MIVIHSDNDRCIEIPGVAAPVRRPVDIDQVKTGFSNLRTLRIYRFDKDAVIEGHAEEDEVFVIVLAGSVELTIVEATADSVGPVMLAAPELADGPCVAYLPPHSAYKLIATTDADVAYARATPSGTGRAKVFSSRAQQTAPGVTLLLSETTWAKRLQLRLLRFDAARNKVAFEPAGENGSPCERLIHITTAPLQGAATIERNAAPAIALTSWDTIAVAPGDQLTVLLATGSSASALMVDAT